MFRQDLFFLLVLFSFFAIAPGFSEPELIVDPLLQRPWISDSEEEEKRSYHRFLSSSREIAKTQLKQDGFGRNYHVYPSMRIRYTIDNDYHREYPILEDADLAVREMEALADAGRNNDAIFLGKSIGLCRRLHEEKEKSFSPVWANEANSLLNRLINRYSDKVEDIFLVSEPYGCYEGGSSSLGNLVLESETFRYRVSVPNTLRYEGLFRKPSGYLKSNSSFSFRLVRFVEFLAPLRSEDWDDMQEAMVLQESGITSKTPRKILFSIGTTFDSAPRLRTAKDYFRFWDKERGLSQGKMQDTAFVRSPENGDYTSRWKSVDETGNISYYQMKEYYFYKAPLGFFLSLSYPESEKEKADRYWNLIRSEFKVKEY
ncbi:LIC10775 family protein [Leptospira idonii]|uniref:Uncharacterized protein n=1 Tax=Leptospira idonii TaxID=1193500 RepID=A0A4R9LXT4_9LEPT|nr:hypothetical protein [Leptospira idonii]TGN18127.1 hypothetical protein EHS15_11965 [Leptospira idonii]